MDREIVMSFSEEQPTLQHNKAKEPFSAIAALLGSGIRFPMAADEPFDPPIATIRRRVPAARTVLARCNGDVFLIFTELGDRDVLPIKEALAAMRSEADPRTLTVACDLPADVNRLGHIVADLRGYSIVVVDGQFVRRQPQEGVRS
jgi:hypothetical protein